ncbi:MAG: hypothetical protein R3245_03470, partial [Kiloniellales bacterium]|nr:hypothetical protein [Kiloniellales bacterium]
WIDSQERGYQGLVPVVRSHISHHPEFSRRLDRLCRAFAAAHKCSYQEAFQAVTTDPDNWDVVHAYALS